VAKEAPAGIKLPKKSYKKGDLPDTADGWVSYINRCHDQGIGDRKKHEFQWVINLAYYMGYQHLVYRDGYIEIPREFRQPLTINRIGSFIESRHAKLTKNRPVPRVIPDSNDRDDVRGARAADKALLHLWRKIHMEDEHDKRTMQMLLCGTAFMKTVWDPLTGDVIEDYKKSSDGMDLLIDEDGEFETEKTFMGEVSTKARSPFCLIPGNDSICNIPDQPWMIERVYMSVADVEEMYPHLRGELQKQDRDFLYTEYEKIVHKLNSPIFNHTVGSGGANAPRDSLNSQVLGKLFWMKPNYQYEKGVVALVVGKQLAMIDVWPNDFGENVYPYVRFVERENGFHFWGQSTIERLISIQRAYNRLKQQKAKNAALMANLKWMVPKGAQLQDESLTDEEGEVVEYNPAVPEPHAAQVAPMPNYVTELARELIVDFRDVGGQRESSVTPPPNVTAGVAMQIAAEISDEVIGPIIRREGRGTELVANQQLLVMDQEWTEPRKVKIFGESNRVDVEWFTNVDFRHHTDVHVEIESLFPEFRGAKTQRILDLWDRKIIDDPKKVLKAFRYGDLDTLLEDDEKVEDSIYLDIQRLKKGKMPEFNPFGNSMLSVKEITKFVQSPEFLRLIPERKQMVIQFMQAHVQNIMQQMPGMGEPSMQTNQNAVGTPFGSTVPAGSPGNTSESVA
jgi:hypothetical protein